MSRDQSSTDGGSFVEDLGKALQKLLAERIAGKEMTGLAVYNMRGKGRCACIVMVM